MKAQAHGGHVSDVMLYTASRLLLLASPYFFALYCHVGFVTPIEGESTQNRP